MIFRKKITLLLIPLFLIFFYVFFYNLIIFNGNKFLYFFFSILSFYLIISIFYEKKYFSEIFLYIYLWLGFWWKFSISQWYYKKDQIVLSTSEGFNPSTLEPQVLNDSFFSLIIAFIAIILTSKAFRIFNKKNYNIINKNEKFFIKFYLKNRRFIILFYIFLFLIIGFTNLHYGIFQKGIINSNNINILIVSFYKWLILIGVTMVGTIILFYEMQIRNSKTFFVTILVLFQNLIISSSHLSRAMILDCAAILYGLNINAQRFLKKNSIKIFKLIIILFLFFFLSFVTSVKLRQNTFNFNFIITEKKFIEKKDELSNYDKNLKFIMDQRETYRKVEETILKDQGVKIPNFEFLLSELKKIFQEMLYLSVKRWVGIDSMIIVSHHSDRNFKIFFDAFKDNSSVPYYEKIFIERFTHNNKDYPDREINKYNQKGNQLIGVITPGFISFFHYPKNNFFLFFIICVVFLLVLYFEKLFIFLSGNNLILVSFFTHLIIYRLIHFGHLPSHTYYFIAAIFFGLLVLFFIKKIFHKIYFR